MSMSQSEGLKGQLLCSAAMVTVGSTVVVSKIIGADMEPFLATAVRHAAALPVFLLLMYFTGASLSSLKSLDWRDACVLGLQAAAGSVGYTVLLIQGVTWSSAADAAVVAGTLPAVCAVFSALFLRERISVRMVAGIALATLGVVAVALTPHSGTQNPMRLAGIALVLAAIACEAVFILGNKRLAQPLPALVMSTVMSAGGLLLCLLPAWWLSKTMPSTLSLPAVTGVLYHAWVPTVLGFWLWYAGSAKTSGARAALATVWLPISALLLSALVLGEAIRPWQWLGLGCVVAAMVLAAWEG
jgi:drug/metabolite transporter (DMT)-like permease